MIRSCSCCACVFTIPCPLPYSIASIGSAHLCTDYARPRATRVITFIIPSPAADGSCPVAACWLLEERASLTAVYFAERGNSPASSFVLDTLDATDVKTIGNIVLKVLSLASQLETSGIDRWSTNHDEHFTLSTFHLSIVSGRRTYGSLNSTGVSDSSEFTGKDALL